MSTRIIVLKTEGLNPEFEDSYWRWQHLLDYVSRELKQRTPQKIKTIRIGSLLDTKGKVAP